MNPEYKTSISLTDFDAIKSTVSTFTYLTKFKGELYVPRIKETDVKKLQIDNLKFSYEREIKMENRYLNLSVVFTVALSILFVFAAPGEAQSIPSPERDGFGGGDADRGWFFQKVLSDFNGMPNLAETVGQTGTLSTLLAAMEAADLTSVLGEPGPFTIFAPNDEAFDRLGSRALSALLKPENKKRLQQILKFHVVPGKYKAAEVVRMSSAPTLLGQDVNFNISANFLYVENAKVLETDYVGSNGVIHIIDTVMIPPILDVDPTFGRNDIAGGGNETAGFSQGNSFSDDAFIGSGGFESPEFGTSPYIPRITLDIVDTAISIRAFSYFVFAVRSADLVAVLKSRGPFTVFVPTDEAFNKLSRDQLSDLFSPTNKPHLASFLALHVVPGKHMESDLKRMSRLLTLNGRNLDIEVRDEGVKVNNASILHFDMLATNGVIHTIDSVLWSN